METTAIIFISLFILYLIVSMFRDNFKEKWYKKGYIDGAYKYDKDYADRMYYEQGKEHSVEARENFLVKYGFHYD